MDWEVVMEAVPEKLLEQVQVSILHHSALFREPTVRSSEFTSNQTAPRWLHPIVRSMSKEELEKSIANTTALMKQAAKDLDFMQAAQYRDEIIRLQKELEEKG